MSEATERMRDFLTKSPSVVFPDEVLELFEPIEQENASLRELVRDYDKCLDTALYLAGNAGYPCMPDSGLYSSLHTRMRELGIEVDDD